MIKRVETRAQMIRRITLRNTILTLVGYALPVFASYAGIFLNLTSCSYRTLNYITLLVLATVGLFILYIFLKKEMTSKMSQLIGVGQLVNWLIISCIWIYSINELRTIALFSAMIPFVFFFSVGTVATSLIITFSFLIIYLVTTYFHIVHLGQGGSFTTEILFSFCFFYSALFLIIMTHIYKKQRKVIKTARADTEKTKREIEQKNLDLSAMYFKITEMVEEIYILSAQVAKDSAGIDISSRFLLDGVTKQVEEINEIADTMHHINQQTSANAGNAVKANELTILARDSSRNGVVQMREVNDAMINISDSGNTISKIIDTIDSISFQTNLLALNAAVEAARAGKHGKGFSVVAQEVRSLALKSAEAASATSNLIEQSKDKVETGTKKSETAVKTLDDINEKIAAVTSLVEEISGSSNKQTDSISQVNASMSKISDITNSTTESAKETNIAASRLASTAEKIHTILLTFNKESRTSSMKELEQN